MQTRKEPHFGQMALYLGQMSPLFTQSFPQFETSRLREAKIPFFQPTEL